MKIIKEERLVGQNRIWHNLNFKREEPKDLKAIKENLKQEKWVFFTWPNMALR